MSGPMTKTAMPPRLTMDDYAAWVSRPCSADRLRLAELQKRIEERILVRFRLAGDTVPGISVHPCPSVVKKDTNHG
jgi:hypothetical protein